jgi:hypothetical protein
VIQTARVGQILQHLRAKTACRALLDGNQRGVVAGELGDKVGVQGLGKAGIGDGGGNAHRRKLFCRQQGFRQMRAKGQQGHGIALADNAALADWQNAATGRHLGPHAFAARIAEGDWPCVMRGGGGDHIDQFRFIPRGHDDKTGQVRKVGHVKGTRMGGPVGPDKSRAVNSKADGQALKRHVMHDLVIAALQEGGIDRHKGFQPAGGHRGGKGDAVLFGNPHIEHPRRKARGHNVQSRAGRHRGGDGDDLAIARSLIRQGLAENSGIGGGVGFGLGLGAGNHIEFRDAVVFVGGVFGGGIAFALDRDGMDQHRPRRAGFRCA